MNFQGRSIGFSITLTHFQELQLFCAKVLQPGINLQLGLVIEQVQRTQL